MFEKNLEIGFQSAVFDLSASVSATIAQWYRPKRNGLYLGLGKTRQSTSYNFNFLQYYIKFSVLLDVMRE